ncbi:hypothetical protein SMC3_07730 [Candidatus Cryosericum hinesii]|uniref:Uncharacterized protein n=1 Tax=Candidatus Cryosericum hinesii TaxID=2290915 RepID=A0A398DM41_9BACT|nr:hypothetical protein SMC4_07190 [Candidatus Cryosericum hinesii]RIE12274.1 hypothetical protein SMC3_07730 [Candidatus Cryosericum hinesii]RIE12408.1 hypothetical protein SMC2_07340 [Candidatus Cryosericum hinesii]
MGDQKRISFTIGSRTSDIPVRPRMALQNDLDGNSNRPAPHVDFFLLRATIFYGYTCSTALHDSRTISPTHYGHVSCLPFVCSQQENDHSDAEHN